MGQTSGLTVGRASEPESSHSKDHGAGGSVNRQTGGLTHTGPKGPMAEPFALSSGRRKEERDGERRRVRFRFPSLQPGQEGGWRTLRERKRMSNAARNWNLVWRVSCSELLALWKGRKLRSPSPRPSPQRRGRTIGRVATNRGLQTFRATNARAPSARGRGRGQVRLSHIGRTRRFLARPAWLPLLWGEGWGRL